MFGKMKFKEFKKYLEIYNLNRPLDQQVKVLRYNRYTVVSKNDNEKLKESFLIEIGVQMNDSSYIIKELLPFKDNTNEEKFFNFVLTRLMFEGFDSVFPVKNWVKPTEITYHYKEVSEND